MSVTDHQEPSATPPVTAPAVTYPSDYEEYRRKGESYDQVMARLEREAEWLGPVLENEDRRNFVKTALETFDERIAKQKPQLSPEMEVLEERLIGKVAPLVEWASGEQQTRAAAKAEEKAAAEKAEADALEFNRQYGLRLMQEHPELARYNNYPIGMLAAAAQLDKISLEESYKRYGDVFAKAAPERKAPPTALRGDAAAPGVPGESQKERATTLKGLRQRLADNLRSGKGN
jgi:hypothetical protein